MFDNKKYIFIIEPDSGAVAPEKTISERIDQFYVTITENIEKMGKGMRTRVDTLEKNTRSRLSYHKEKISQVKGLIHQLTDDFN